MGARAVWWRIAWRNLWRNARRTALTAAALAFGFLAAVVIVGISDGVTREMVENGTEVITGQIQLHSPDYRPERSLHETLGGREGIALDDLLDRVARVPGVTSAAPRVHAGGLISSGEETVAAGLMGIEPQAEARVSRVASALVLGRAPVIGAHEIMIGTEMARKLGVDAGDEVVLVAPAADGSMGNDLFRVVGVFHTGVAGLDGFQVVLPIDVLQDLLVLDRRRVHEVAVDLEDAWSAPLQAQAITSALGADAGLVVVEPWTEFRSELAEYASLAGAGNFVIVAIVFGMAIFGVANTMLMATFERRREFAVVRALGTTPASVARTVVYEGVMLGGLALLVGGLVTWPIMVWLHNSPIDLSRLFGDITMAGSVVRPLISADYSVEGPLISAVALFATSLLAALFPAYRSVRIPPADVLAGR